MPRRDLPYISLSLFPPRRLLRAVALAMLTAVITDLSAAALAQGRARHPQRVAGQRAVIIDDRLAALRAAPDVRAALIQRLSRGRVVGLLKTTAAKGGPPWHQVFVTRRTRGWVLAESLVRSGRAEDATRLLKLIEETKDDFNRAKLARLCADEFRATPAAPRALLLLGEAAEAASKKLTLAARRRVGDDGETEADTPAARPAARLSRREYLLNHTGLDRWNRAGITFEYDTVNDQIIYDGAAYREVMKKYPRSEATANARQALGQQKQK